MGCNELPVELPDTPIPKTGKVILLEDVTGVGCSNCPRAAKRLEEIKALYPEQVIILGIHGTQQTEPYTESAYDFRNEDAIFMEEHLRPFLGKPAVAFNRRQFPDEQNLSLSNRAQFQPKAEELLTEEQTVSIATRVDTVDNRTIEIYTGITPLLDMQGDYYISVMIAESGIIDYQLDADYGGYNPEYVHNHVLRDIVTQPLGQSIGSAIEKNKTINRSWTYDLHPEWDMSNIEIIVAITNQKNGSKEVLQADIVLL